MHQWAGPPTPALEHLWSPRAHIWSSSAPPSLWGLVTLIQVLLRGCVSPFLRPLLIEGEGTFSLSPSPEPRPVPLLVPVLSLQGTRAWLAGTLGLDTCPGTSWPCQAPKAILTEEMEAQRLALPKVTRPWRVSPPLLETGSAPGRDVGGVVEPPPQPHPRSHQPLSPQPSA